MLDLDETNPNKRSTGTTFTLYRTQQENPLLFILLWNMIWIRGTCNADYRWNLSFESQKIITKIYGLEIKNIKLALIILYNILLRHKC
jgi:hypothetical protein